MQGEAGQKTEQREEVLRVVPFAAGCPTAGIL
jgi:hypothetical protein